MLSQVIHAHVDSYLKCVKSIDVLSHMFLPLMVLFRLSR
jgi:hypothetical protein